MAHDIVYLLRNGVDSEELRYSLRSVQANFPHNRIWFVGGCPDDIVPDIYLPMKQQGNTKWARSSHSLKTVIYEPDLTDDFWLFNDDFFILQPTDNLPYMYKGELKDRGVINSAYMRMLKETEEQLTKTGLTTFDYAIHVPMLINKQKAQIVFRQFPNNPMFRCLYGNYWQVGGELVSDVKIYDRETLPPENARLCSTVDEIFRFGAVGKYIRSLFPEPSKWECKKTRLVDVGKLLYKWGRVDGVGQWVIRKSTIMSQPTVEAIPIEWLKQYCENKTIDDTMDCYWHFFKEDVLQMIDDWGKENDQTR